MKRKSDLNFPTDPVPISDISNDITETTSTPAMFSDADRLILANFITNTCCVHPAHKEFICSCLYSVKPDVPVFRIYNLNDVFCDDGPSFKRYAIMYLIKSPKADKTNKMPFCYWTEQPTHVLKGVQFFRTKTAVASYSYYLIGYNNLYLAFKLNQGGVLSHNVPVPPPVAPIDPVNLNPKAALDNERFLRLERNIDQLTKQMQIDRSMAIESMMKLAILVQPKKEPTITFLKKQRVFEEDLSKISQEPQSAQPCVHANPHPDMTCEAYDACLLQSVKAKFISDTEAEITVDPNSGYWPEDEEFIGDDDGKCNYCLTPGLFLENEGVCDKCSQILSQIDLAKVQQTPQSHDEFDGFFDKKKTKYVKGKEMTGSVKLSFSPNSQRSRDPTSVVAQFKKEDEAIIASLKLDNKKKTPGQLKAQIRRQVRKAARSAPVPSSKVAYVNEFWDIVQEPQMFEGFYKLFDPKTWTDAAADSFSTKIGSMIGPVKESVKSVVSNYGDYVGRIIKAVLFGGGLFLAFIIYKRSPRIGCVMFGALAALATFCLCDEWLDVMNWCSLKSKMTEMLSKGPEADYKTIEMNEVLQFGQFNDGDLDYVKTTVTSLLACATIGPDVYRLNPKAFAGSIAKFPSVSKGVNELVPFISDLIIGGINSIRTVLGYEKLKTLSTSQKQFGDWAEAAGKFLNKAASNEIAITYENMEYLLKLMAEGRHHMQTLKELPQTDRIRMTLTTIIHQLGACTSSFNQLGYGSAGMRQMPLGVYIYGPSGIGKSCLVNRAGKVLLARILPPDRLQRYLKNPDTEQYSVQIENEYADGYHGQTLSVFDDLLQSKFQKANSESMNIIRMTNMYPHVLHMAGLLQKGNTCFTSTVLIASANDPVIVDESVRHPEAVQRRFEVMVEMKLHPEYKTAKGTIDVAKVEAKGPNFMDYCFLQSYTVLPNGETRPGRTFTFDQFIDDLVERYQEKMMEYRTYSAGTKSLLEEHVKKNMYLVSNTEPSKISQEGQILVDDAVLEKLSELDNNELSTYKYYTKAMRPAGWVYNPSEFEDSLRAIVSAEGICLPKAIINNVNNELIWMRGICKTIMKMIPLGTVEIKFAQAIFIMFKMSGNHPLSAAQWVQLLTVSLESDKTILDLVGAELKPFADKWVLPDQPVKDLRFEKWWSKPDVRAKYSSLPIASAAQIEQFAVNNLDLLSSWDDMPDYRRQAIFTIIDRSLIRRPDVLDGAILDVKDLRATEIMLLSQRKTWFESFYDWIWSKLGAAFTFFMEHWKTVMVAIGAISAVAGIYFLGSWLYESACGVAKVPQEPDSSHGKRDQQVHKRTNMPKKEDILAKIKQQPSYSVAEDTANLVWANNVYTIWNQDRTSKLLQGLILYEKMVLTNYHLIAAIKANGYQHVWMQHVQGGNFIKVLVSDILNSPEVGNETRIQGDSLIFWADSASFPTGKYIVPKFITKQQAGKFTKYPALLGLVRGNVVERHHVVAEWTPNPLPYTIGPYKFEFPALWFYRNVETKGGDCGVPLMLDITSPQCIVGIHTAAAPEKNAASTMPLFQEDIIDRCSKFTAKHGVSIVRYPHILQCPTIVMSSNPFCDVGLDDVGIVVSLKQGYNQPRQTQLEATPLHGKFGESTKKPAKLGVCEVGEEIVNPKYKNFLEVAREIPSLSQSKVEYIAHCIINSTKPIPGDPWYSQVDKDGKPNWKRRLTYEEAVAGVRGELNGIDRSTSPGYPNILSPEGMKGKRYYLGEGENYDFKSKGALELKKRVDELEASMREGIRPDTYYADFLKDETLKNEKVDIAKTRIIAADELAMLILYRMYYGSFMIHWTKQRIFNSSAIGVNPYSSEWQDIWNQLRSVGIKAFDGDYKFWDKFFLACLALGVFGAIDIFFGIDNPDNMVRKCLAHNFAHAIHILNKEKLPDWAFQKLVDKVESGIKLTEQEKLCLTMHYASSAFAVINFCGFPSGNALTAHLNTIAGVVLSVLACGEAENLHLTDYWSFWQKNCKMIGLGDDHVISVSENCKNYNAITHADYVAKIGMQYTAADKSPNLRPFTDFKDIVFLKRGFRMEDGIVYAPLQWDSIRESCYWARKDGDNEKCKINFQNQLYELALHGEQVFKEKSSMMLRAYENCFGNLPQDIAYHTCLLRAVHMDYHLGVNLASATIIPQMDSRGDLATGKSNNPGLSGVGFTGNQLDCDLSLIQQSPSAAGEWSLASSQQRTAQSIDDNAITETKADTTESVGTTTFTNMGEVPKSTTTLTLAASDFLLHNVLCKDKPDAIDDFLYKPIPIATGTLTAGGHAVNDELYSGYGPDIFLADTQVAAKILGFQGIRGTMEYRLQVNTNGFQQGRLIMYSYPYAGSADPTYTFRKGNIRCSHQFPHVELDMSCDTEAVLEVPYVSPFSFSDLTLPQTATHRLAIIVYAPLKTGLGSTAVTWTLYGNYKTRTAKLYNPTAPAFVTQVPQSAILDAEKAQAMKPGAILKSIGSFASMVSENVPVLKPLAKPVSWITDLAAKGLSSFGFSRPSSTTTYAKVVTKALADQITVDGLDTAESAAFTKKNELQYYPDIAGMPVDEMALDSILTRFVYTDTVECSTSTAANTQLWSFELTPSNMGTQVATLHYGHPAYMMSYLFRSWRGNLRIRFKAVKTTYHSGRFAVVFYPGAENSSDPKGHARYVHQDIIDLAKGSQWTFEFPYTSQNCYEFSEIKTGTVYLILLSKITAPDTCSAFVNFIIETAMAPGAEFIQPVGTAVRAQDAAIADPAEPRRHQMLPSGSIMESYSGIRQKPQMMVDNAKVDPCEVHPKMLIGGDCAHHLQLNTAAACVGEKLNSVRQLIKRPSQFCEVATGTTDGVVNPWLIAGTNSAATTTIQPDWLDAFRPLFAYERGGMIVRLRGTSTINCGPYWYDTNARLTDGVTLETGLQSQMTQMVNYNDISLPPWQQNPLCKISYVGGSSDTYACNRDTCVAYNRTTGTVITFQRIPRDDYSLHCYIGMPPVTLSTPLSAGFRERVKDRPLPAIHGGAVQTSREGKGSGNWVSEPKKLGGHGYSDARP